jgi:hypothetical protein
VRPGWDGVEGGSIDIEEGFVTVVYAQYRAGNGSINETHLGSYCCIQPIRERPLIWVLGFTRVRRRW